VRHGQILLVILRSVLLCVALMMGYAVISLVLWPVALLLKEPVFRSFEKRELPLTLFKAAFITVLLILLVPGWRRWVIYGKLPWQR
jgi:predicted membrane protein